MLPTKRPSRHHPHGMISALRDQLGQARSFVRYLKPEFLDEVSESCVLQDA
jgi:hypothetical protein